MDKSSAIFITGATGLVGSYICRYLIKQGYSQIFALRRKESSMSLLAGEENKITWIIGDVQNPHSYADILPKMDYVIHGAAIISFSPKREKNMYRINIDGTGDLVNLCLEAGVKKLLHVSSTAAIGRLKKVQNISEESKWQTSAFNTKYGISKHFAEMEVWRGIAEGLQAVIINPSVIIGSGFWHNGSSNIFQKVWNGIPYFPVGTNGYVDVRDVAKMSIQLLSSSIVGERFLAVADNLDYKTLFQWISECYGKKGPTSPLSKTLGSIGWRAEALKSVFTGRDPLITKETILQASCTYHYDNTKSLEQLNYSYLDLKNSIKETAQQYQSSQKNGSPFAVLPLI